MRPSGLISIALSLFTVLILAMYAADAETPARAPLVIVFLLTTPGMALMQLFGLKQPMVTAVMGVALSLGVATIVSTALLSAHIWTPGRALAMVGGVTLLACTVHFYILSGCRLPKVPGLRGERGHEDED